MLTGRAELIQQSLALLPTSTRLDMLNQQGHTALMLATLYNDDVTLMVILCCCCTMCSENLRFQALMDAGASVDIETPAPVSPNFSAVNGETQHWTALTYAAVRGYTRCARLLLERGANVEGGAHLSEEKCTLTPLQVILLLYAISLYP